jgi:hypothetical protein
MTPAAAGGGSDPPTTPGTQAIPSATPVHASTLSCTHATPTSHCDHASSQCQAIRALSTNDHRLATLAAKGDVENGRGKRGRECGRNRLFALAG